MSNPAKPKTIPGEYSMPDNEPVIKFCKWLTLRLADEKPSTFVTVDLVQKVLADWDTARKA